MMRSAPAIDAWFASVLVLLTLLAGAPSAEAGLSRNPFKLQLLSEERPAAAGDRYEGRLALEVGTSVELYDFELAGEGWTIHELQAPMQLIADAGQRVELSFAATPADPEQPLWVYFTADGKRARARADLSPVRYVEHTRAWPLIVRTDLAPAAGGDETSVPEPAHAPDEIVTSSGTEGLGKSRTITVSGRFVYTRSDGQTIGGYGLTAKVYDDNGVFPAGFLGSAVTNSSGDFSVTFTWSNVLDPDPDLYVQFITESGRVLVRSDGLFSGPYSWATSVRQNYTGTNLNVGTVMPANESQMPRVHILTNATRTWAYVDTYAGFDTPKITYLYPSDNWPAYNQFFQQIYIPNDFGDDEIQFQWRESTHVHEWGHHFINSFGQPTIPDYCNGICDTVAQGWVWELDCGHCAWCQETETDAFAEGWPNWLADVVTRRFATSWGGIPAMNTRSQENLQNCRDSESQDCPCDPWRTEGYLGALLRDIEDATQDDHDGDGFTDALALGIDEIFFVTTAFATTTPEEFLDAFAAVYPQHREALWETAFNVGYQIDDAKPGAVGNFTSPSHATTGDSPDRTVDLTWTHATDDMSGIAGYSIAINQHFAQIPSATPSLGKVTSFTTPDLSPGTWYFSIRAVDRSGKASDSHRVYGPVTIRSPDPANLSFYPRTGWAEVLVPRSTNDATISNVSAPIYLDPATTYINLTAQNDGESGISGQTTRVYVDDVYRYWMSWGNIPGGGKIYALNQGSFSVRGGRHTFEARLDALEHVSETDETDNAWAKQWIWGPPQLQPTGPLTYSKPPASTGGWSAIPAGTTQWFNADGYRMSSYSGFHATVVRATSLSDDYDARLHPMSTGASNGFTSNVGYSTRPAGCLDVVLTNAWQTGVAGFDVGVLNRFGGTSNYVIENYAATKVTFGDSTTVAVPANQYFVLREFVVNEQDTGAVSITLEVDPGAGNWQMVWFDASFVTGDLLDHDAYTTTDASGRARLDLTIPTASFPGTHAVAFFRDPRDGSAATSITYEIGRTPPDFLALHPNGWHSPLVPRPALDGTPSSVPVPDLLPGNTTTTYFNVAMRNESPTGVPGMTAHIFRDGVASWYLSWGNLPGYSQSLFNWSTPWSVPGGRHTLSVRHDVNAVHEEISEENNIYGEQYVWSPYELSADKGVSRSMPRSRTGGWEDVRSGEPLWFNCDGLRTPPFAISGRNGYWGYVAVLPSGQSNVDLRLHEVSTGAKNGFASNLGYSGWGDGESELLVINFRETTLRPFDAGVLAIAGSGEYTAQSGGSTWLPNNGASHGPYTLSANAIVHLYEMNLDRGVHIVHLQNLSANLDLGVSVYGPGAAVRTKASTLADGAAWLSGAGEDEWLTIEVTETGYHAIAVWKRDSSARGLSGSYTLRVDTGITSVDPEVTVRRTALEAITPNPFNPQTSIRFALEQGGPVEIVVYNLRGELVRTLVREERIAGRHVVTWNGRDDRGSQVASGVYSVMLRAGSVEDRRKVTLVK
jgi:hypothetical protein